MMVIYIEKIRSQQLTLLSLTKDIPVDIYKVTDFQFAVEVSPMMNQLQIIYSRQGDFSPIKCYMGNRR